MPVTRIMKQKETYKLGLATNLWVAFAVFLGGVCFWTSFSDEQIGHIFKHLNEEKIPVHCKDVAIYLTDTHNTHGQHVLCIDVTGHQIHAQVWKNGLLGQHIEFDVGPVSASWEDIQKSFDTIVEYKPTTDLAQRFQNPWAFFTLDGRPISNTTSFVHVHGAFLLEGGVWLWPGVQLGFKQRVELDVGNITLHTLSLSPLVIAIDKVLLEEEIDYIIDVASKDFKPSTVLTGGVVGEDDSGYRTSQHTWLLEPNKKIEIIDNRIAELSRCPLENQEHAQVVKYNIGQKFWAHCDYHDASEWDTKTHKKQKWDIRLHHGYGNRLLTILWYMSDVEAGGDTWFASKQWYNVKTDAVVHNYLPLVCTTGLSIKPEKGSAVMFYSMLPNGRLDPKSLHAGCPVQKGVKYIANKWIWNKKFIWI